MESTETPTTEDRSKEAAPEKSSNSTVDDAASLCVPVLARQYSASEGGVTTDMLCPNCGEEINGSYLPVFKCPHCKIQIWRDENGNVTSFEIKNVCPECGRGSATELAKQALITSLVSGFKAILLYSFQADHYSRIKKPGGVSSI